MVEYTITLNTDADLGITEIKANVPRNTFALLVDCLLGKIGLKPVPLEDDAPQDEGSEQLE